MFVEFSEEEIGEPILGAGPDNPATRDDDDLLRLVDHLLAREVAMWVFVYTITDIYGSSEIADSVHAVVSRHLAEPVLSREQRIDLHRLCRSLVDLDVRRLFMMSVDPIGYALRSDPQNLCAVLNELEEFQARDSDGLHPIAAFVEYLAGGQPPESADRLRAWLSGFVGSRTPHLNALRSIRVSDLEPDDQDSLPQPYCTIYLDADGVDASRCYFSAYFQDGSHPVVPLALPDDEPYTEAQIRARIGDALNSRVLTGVLPDELRIEFFLPTFLLSLPVDRWRVGAAGITLGVQYQVVVRSQTRLQDLGSAHAYLRGKWSRVGTTQFSIPSGISGTGFRSAGGTGWLTEEAADHQRDQVFVSLTRDGGPVCLLLAESPAPDHCLALTLALAGGVPVLMWSRRRETDLISGLGGLLAGVTPLWLRDLPQHVLRLRSDAALRQAGEDDLAYQLTLLYDDGNRIPDAESLPRTFG
jgi:hypothetical protein